MSTGSMVAVLLVAFALVDLGNAECPEGTVVRGVCMGGACSMGSGTCVRFEDKGMRCCGPAKSAAAPINGNHKTLLPLLRLGASTHGSAWVVNIGSDDGSVEKALARSIPPLLPYAMSKIKAACCVSPDTEKELCVWVSKAIAQTE